jgi:hypothetical protein
VIRATLGENYSPAFPSSWALGPKTIKGKQQKNGFVWSEENEPENVPPANYAFAGSNEIYKIVATRDCLWFFCSDGLFRLSGNGGSVGDGYDWVLDPVDPSLVISGPNCAVVYREYVYAQTNRGFVTISSEGQVRELSDGRLNGSISTSVTATLTNRPWQIVPNTGIGEVAMWMVADPINDEVLLRRPPGNTSGNQAIIWAYNTKTDTFMTRRPSFGGTTKTPVAAVYSGARGDVIGIWEGLNSVTSPNTPSALHENMLLVFQPIYGVGSTASHTQKHWQDIQIAFRTPQFVQDATVYFVGTTGSEGRTRSIPYVTNGFPVAEDSRVGFSIARNHPAMGNALGFRIDVQSFTSSVPVAIEAISINYIEFSDERIMR